MSQTIKLKRSAVTGNVPTTAQLELGEVAINTYDGKLFIKKDDGTASVIEVGSAPAGYNNTNWDTAYGWGDHALAGYSTTDTVYTLPEATATTRGGIELFSNTDQTVAANAISSIASRTYGIQLNSAGQAVVNVPWVNTDNNTWRPIHDAPVDGATTTSISSNWAFDNVKTAVPAGALFTDTVYSHPTHPGDDFSVDTGPLTGATVVSDIDINVTTDTLGHVTDANGVVSTRTLTLADLGYTGATNANNYSLPEATSTARGGIELFSDTDQTVAANAVSATAGRTYGLQLNSAGQAVVNVPWSDTNTVYTHPSHPGDDISIDTGALSGATVISDLDFNVTTDTLGHVTDANATISTRSLTAADVGAAPASHSHNYISEGGTSFTGTYPVAVRVSANNFYSDADISFTGSTSILNTTGGYSVGTTTFIDSARNLSNIGTISAAGSISVTGYNSVNAYSGAFTYITGALTGDVVGNVTGNSSTATKWATPRTITLGGDLTGSVSIDGSANVTLSGQVVNDSHNHDHSDGNFTINGGLTVSGNLARGTYESLSQYHTGADNIVLKGNSVGRSGIFFESEKDGVNINHPSDFGFIQYHAYGTGTTGESSELIIGTSNDADDHVILNTPSTTGVRVRVGVSETDYPVFHDAYHPNADKWTTARTLSLTGDVTGSVSWDGSGNASLTATVADDSHSHVWGNIDGASIGGLAGPRFTTGSGYIEFGPANATWAHIYTDRPNFYFNKNLYILGQRVFADDYHPNADKWTSARVLTLTGDVSGTVTWDGSANVSMGVAVLDNSHSHSNYITSNTADTATGKITFAGGLEAQANYLSGAQNFDNLKLSGFYSLYNANATGSVNAPIQYGAMISAGNTAVSGGMAMQLVHERLGNGTFIRGMNDTNDTWYPWQRIFMDNYHPNADKWTTARTLSLTGDVSGSVSWDGSGNASITTVVADDSHNHTIANIDGLQTALNGKQAAGTYNTIIGTDTDLDTSGSTIIDNIYVTDGVITSMGTRTLTAGDIGALTTSGKAADSELLDGVDSSRVVFGSNSTKTTSNTQPSQILPSGFYDMNTTNTPTATWYSWINIRHNNSGNNHGHQIAGSFYDTNLWSRNINNNTYGAWTKKWDTANDGSGSGLDADLLDGQHASAFLGVSAKAADSNLLDGIDSGSFLRSDATDYLNGVMYVRADIRNETAYRDHGVYGDYDSTKTNHIWSMGSSYRNSAAGTNFGNLYGLAYKHTNNPTGGTMGGGHQMVWCSNGTPLGSIGLDRVWHAFGMRVGSSDVWHAGNDGAGSGLDADLLDGQHASAFLGVSAKAADSNLLDGLDLHTGRNNEANKVVRTDASGYIQAGWINTTSGLTTGTGRIYASNDSYLRYVTNDTFRNNLGLWWSGNDGSGSGLDADLLDGQHASAFAPVSHSHSYLPLSGGTLTGNVVAPQFRVGDGGNGYFFTDSDGRTAFAGGDFYIQESCNTYYNYANNQYHGNSSGDNHYFRGNALSGNNWTISTVGAANFSGGVTSGNYVTATGNITSNNGWVKSGAGGFYVSSNQIVDSGRNLLNIGNITCSGTNNTYGDINIRENVSAPGYTFMRFQSYSTGATLGSIYRSYGSMVYSTSSDYRLKENVVNLTGASDKIKSLPVRRFNFIEHPDRTVDGFLAHEVAAVVPEAVLGEKDAVDSKGKPVYQAIDQSKLVPLLTAGLQEALAEIEKLKARLSALEN